LIDEFSSRRVVRDITRTEPTKKKSLENNKYFFQTRRGIDVDSATSRDAVSRVVDSRDDCTMLIVETSEKKSRDLVS
jgi:hypothetical protein